MTLTEIIVYTLILISLIGTFDMILMNRSTGKYTRWYRKLFWYRARNVFIKAANRSTPLLSYPLIAYISLDPEPKNIFIEKGFKACKDVVLKKLDTIFETSMNIREEVEKRNQYYEEFEEKYPESDLDEDEIDFIKQYEEEMKKSKS